MTLRGDGKDLLSAMEKLDWLAGFESETVTNVLLFSAVVNNGHAQKVHWQARYG